MKRSLLLFVGCLVMLNYVAHGCESHKILSHEKACDILQWIKRITDQRRIELRALANADDGHYPIHEAVRAKDLLQVASFCEAGVDLNKGNEHKQTPLHIAAHFDCADIARLLIAAKAQVNLKDEYGRTALHLATVGVCLETVKVLLEAAGIDVNACDDNGDTALDLTDSTKIGSLLLDAGARINSQIIPLLNHCYMYNDPRIKLFVTHGADVNAVDADGQSGLYIAAAEGSTDIMRFLLAWGADVHAIEPTGYTALHITAFDCISGREKAQLLLAHGARLNCQDKEGETPLQIATLCAEQCNGQRELVKLLRGWPQFIDYLKPSWLAFSLIMHRRCGNNNFAKYLCPSLIQRICLNSTAFYTMQEIESMLGSAKNK